MRILYAEDERQLSIAIAEILKLENYEVDAVYDGAEAWAHLQANYYDAVILDIMMPHMDGIEVIKLMRRQNNYTPVLMLTAKNTTEDRIEGLSIGADDYLGKPFAAKELLARLNSMLRRSMKYKNSFLTLGNIMLDCSTNELKSDRGSLRLSGREGDLLAMLIKNHSHTVTPQAISELLGDADKNESTVKLYISYLKNKLEQLHADVNLFESPQGYQIGENKAI